MRNTTMPRATLAICVGVLGLCSCSTKNDGDKDNKSGNAVTIHSRIESAIPDDWQIVDTSDIETGVLTEPSQQHADKYLKAESRLCCLLQPKDRTGAITPTICLVPGKDFVDKTPENGNLRGGTTLVAGLFAAQMAWLAVSEDNALPAVSDAINMPLGKSFAGHEGMEAEMSGDYVTLVGVTVSVDKTPLAVGYCAQTGQIDDVRRVAEQIVRQINGNLAPE